MNRDRLEWLLLLLLLKSGTASSKTKKDKHTRKGRKKIHGDRKSSLLSLMLSPACHLTAGETHAKLMALLPAATAGPDKLLKKLLSAASLVMLQVIQSCSDKPNSY